MISQNFIGLHQGYPIMFLDCFPAEGFPSIHSCLSYPLVNYLNEVCWMRIGMKVYWSVSLQEHGWAVRI